MLPFGIFLDLFEILTCSVTGRTGKLSLKDSCHISKLTVKKLA